MPFRADVLVASEGEFAGWTTWRRDSFESNNGPFWHKVEADGRVRCAFRVEAKHLNGMKNVHGGCYMTFADYCLFAIASRELQGPGHHRVVRLRIPRCRPRRRAHRLRR
jgi:acyl-coenzyme A thioesterase PaaI-like protein